MPSGATTFEKSSFFQDKEALPASLQVLLEQCWQSSHHRKWPSRRSSPVWLKSRVVTPHHHIPEAAHITPVTAV